MKISDMKIGDVVSDRWYSGGEYKAPWGNGKITRILKTVVYISFSGLDKEIRYDIPHARKFLYLVI